jgi:hypothetical protein
MTERFILVRGHGMAACCSARLLQRQGCCAPVAEAKRPTLPAILVSESTQNLLADTFRSRKIFEGLPRIRKRIVAWSEGESIVLPHSAIVVSEQTLLDRLWALNDATGSAPSDPHWTIVTARPTENPPQEMEFGSRRALVSEVGLKDETERDACWVESVESGWLFLLATGDGRGSLISVGGPGEQLLAKSRLVARQVKELGEVKADFPAYPRIATNLCGAGWLACGTAAMSFDPLCGEGAGNAVREAILACAAVQAIASGEAVDELLQEYSMRLRLGFLRHLDNCRAFYRRYNSSLFWTSELALIEQGIAWTKSQIGAAPNPRFRLVDFSLKRVNSGKNL